MVLRKNVDLCRKIARVTRIAIKGRVATSFGKRGCARDDRRTAAAHRLQRGDAEPLIYGGKDEAQRIGVESSELAVADGPDIHECSRIPLRRSAKMVGIHPSGDHQPWPGRRKPVHGFDDDREILGAAVGAERKDVALRRETMPAQDRGLVRRCDNVLGRIRNNGDRFSWHPVPALQLARGKVRHCHNSCRAGGEDAMHDLVPGTKCKGVAARLRAGRGIVNCDDLSSVRQGCRVGETQQHVGPGRERQVDLLPRLTRSRSDRAHRDSLQRSVFNLTIRWDEQDDLGRSQRTFLAQDSIKRPDDLAGKSLNAGGWLRQESAIDRQPGRRARGRSPNPHHCDVFAAADANPP